jgi:hypothetical protein
MWISGQWFLSRRGLSDLSRRDKRTEPGVLTPGIYKKMVRPEWAAERGFVLPKCRPDLKRTVCHPFRVRSLVGSIPGVKTPGSVLLSLRDKSDTSRRDGMLVAWQFTARDDAGEDPSWRVRCDGHYRWLDIWRS